MTEETIQEDQPLLLMVDDDPTFTRVMARALSRRGLQVETAGGADEAMRIARERRPDYAVLDLKMEGDSGLVLMPQRAAMQSQCYSPYSLSCSPCLTPISTPPATGSQRGPMSHRAQHHQFRLQGSPSAYKENDACPPGPPQTL